MEAGAGVNAKAARYKGATALQAAALVGDWEMVEMLVEGRM